MSVKPTVNIPDWKVKLVKKYFQQEEKNRVSSSGEVDIEEEFEHIFSQSFSVETLDYDPDVLKTPRSLKELASNASMSLSNDSGYEGVDSGLKIRRKLEFSFTEEEKQEERTEDRVEKESGEVEDNSFLGSMLEILKMYVVVVSLLYMVYMSETSVGGDLGGKKAAIQFYYDSQQL